MTLPSKLYAVAIPSSHSGCAAQSFPQGKPTLPRRIASSAAAYQKPFPLRWRRWLFDRRERRRMRGRSSPSTTSSGAPRHLPLSWGRRDAAQKPSPWGKVAVRPTGELTDEGGRSLPSTTSSGAPRHLPLIGEGTQARHIASSDAADQKPSPAAKPQCGEGGSSTNGRTDG